MHRKKKAFKTAPTSWDQSFTIIFSSFCLLTSILFASQAQANTSTTNTNAKGIAIEFLLDDLIDAELADAPQTVDEQTILTLTPAMESIPYEDNLWLRIQAGYAMPDIVSPHTSKYENRYASKPAYVDNMMARSQRYLFYVVEEVEKRDMPTEIALLPMIESAYNPKAYSRSRALGIWQFMPATGKHFGLQQNWWVDNRRDITAATQAALDYLQKLHVMFGSWDLALAAYNAGEGTVSRAIAKNQKAGLPTDYQSLKLPLETMHYVPKLQAIKNIVNNPERYGLSVPLIPNQAYFAEVDPPHQIDAKLAAKLAEISNEEFALLNPSYNRPIIASRNNSHKILLPVSAIETFETNLSNYDQALVSWKTYQAKRGERLADIAKKFKISITQLRNVNDLPRGRSLSKNLHLLVPANQSEANKINVASLANQKTKVDQGKSSHVTHKIKRGETLSALAKKYGTNTKALMKMNRLKSTKLKIGQIIRVKGKPVSAKTKRI